MSKSINITFNIEKENLQIFIKKLSDYSQKYNYNYTYNLNESDNGFIIEIIFIETLYSHLRKNQFDEMIDEILYSDLN